MKRYSVLLALALMGGFAALIRAGDEDTRPLPEDLSGWEWYDEVALPAGPRPKLADLIVPPAVFGRARQDLDDLRLVDGQDQPIQYALRVLRGQNEARVVPGTAYDRTWTPASGVASVSLDLGESPPEQNSITINTSGSGYRRAVRLEGSNDKVKWAVVLDGVWLINFSSEKGPVDVRQFTYTPARFRYLRVEVFRDRGLANDEPQINQVEVTRTVHVPAEMLTVAVQPGAREPVPAGGGPGSAWLIDLGETVPVEKVYFDIKEQAFTRPYVLQILNPGESPRYLAQGEWKRQPGQTRQPMEVSFSETPVRRFRLLVTDYGNSPLTLGEVRYSAPARQVVFSPPAEGGVKLYFGNPSAEAPRYDFASSLPPKLEPPPIRTTLGEPVHNPGYRPPPKPWTERYRWLVDVVLLGASVALLGILAVLGRSAVKRHDAAVTSGAA